MTRPARHCTHSVSPQKPTEHITLPQSTNKCTAVRESCKRASGAMCTEQRRQRCLPGRAEGAASPPLLFFFLLLFVTWQTPRLLQRASDRRSRLYMRTPPSTLLQPGVVGEHTTPARSRFGAPYSNEEQRGSVLLQQGVDLGLPPARLCSGAFKGYRGFQLP